jgi:Fe-Mn family superoxide dismutase|tara:strand:- start:515 stop:1057 length:543 start_codon:yes stop_codon:yes gene_type:complete
MIIMEVTEKEQSLVLEKLPYDMGDLSPVLSKDNVDYHYNVLSKGYVDRYNAGEGDPDFNYGGAKLHNLWWTQLKKPAGSNTPSGSILELIKDKYSDYKKFQEELVKTAMGIQGSGWVYLSKKGELKTTPNQSYKKDILMPIDMWEHSFSDYTTEGKECKKKYLTSVMKIINWEVINNRLQ